MKFALPSVRDLVFILLFWALLIGPLSNRPLADADIGWHIRTGEIILATHSIPRTDPFSATLHGQPWIDWEWLYDALLGALHRAMGLNAVVLLAALIISATFTIFLSQLLRKGTGLPLAVLLFLLAFAAASIHLFARPHIVSWLFTLLWFVVLDRWDDGDTARWLRWFFPLSMLLWVNLHGGWLFGLALLAVYTLAALLESIRGMDAICKIRAGQRARGMVFSLVASMLITIVNPYGLRLHAHIYGYLSDRYLIDRIDEFRSPDFHGWAQRAFALILILVLMALVASPRRLRLSQFFVVLLAVYAGLYSARSLPVSSMLLVLVAGPLLWEALASLADRGGAWIVLKRTAGWLTAFSARATAGEFEFRGHLWPALVVMLALATCLHTGHWGSRQIIHAEFDPQRLPVAAVDFLAAEPGSQPVFAPDAWGGYLIYRLYPRRLVVLDDRHDLYGADRFRDYLTLILVQPEWKKVTEKWDLQTLVLPKSSSLANILRELPQKWQVVYEDKLTVVIEKKSSVRTTNSGIQ